MAPPVLNNAEPDVQQLRIQLEVARASRRQFVATLSFRQGYVAARRAYFEGINAIVTRFREGVAANPPTATRAQLADALTRKETDEVQFPDLSEDDVTSDVPSVVEPLIPPQLVSVAAPEANKDVFDPKAIGLAIVPSFDMAPGGATADEFVEAVDGHQALRRWTDHQAATAALSKMTGGSPRVLMKDLIRERAPELVSWRLLRTMLLTEFSNSVNHAQRCHVLRSLLNTQEDFNPRVHYRALKDAVADIVLESQIPRNEEGHITVKGVRDTMTNALFGASLTKAYLAEVQRAAPATWEATLQHLTAFHRGRHVDSAITKELPSTVAEYQPKAAAAAAQDSKDEGTTVDAVGNKKQPEKKKKFEKKDNAHQNLTCFYCHLAGHISTNCQLKASGVPPPNLPTNQQRFQSPQFPNAPQGQQQYPFHRAASHNYPPNNQRGRGQPRGRPFNRGRGQQQRGRGYPQQHPGQRQPAQWQRSAAIWDEEPVEEPEFWPQEQVGQQFYCEQGGPGEEEFQQFE